MKKNCLETVGPKIVEDLTSSRPYGPFIPVICWPAKGHPPVPRWEANGCYNNNWKNPFSVQVLFSLHHLSGSYSLPIVRYFIVLKMERCLNFSSKPHAYPRIYHKHSFFPPLLNSSFYLGSLYILHLCSTLVENWFAN